MAVVDAVPVGVLEAVMVAEGKADAEAMLVREDAALRDWVPKRGEGVKAEERLLCKEALAAVPVPPLLTEGVEE